jgi:hypothetical protein
VSSSTTPSIAPGERSSFSHRWLVAGADRASFVVCSPMVRFDDWIQLKTGEWTTLRAEASEGRMVLRRSLSYRGSGETSAREACWAEVLTNPVSDYEISEAKYAELKALGIPDAPNP